MLRLYLQLKAIDIGLSMVVSLAFAVIALIWVVLADKITFAGRGLPDHQSSIIDRTDRADRFR